GARGDLLRPARLAHHPAVRRSVAEPPAAHGRRREECTASAAAERDLRLAGDDGESRGGPRVWGGAPRGGRCRRVPRSRDGGAADTRARATRSSGAERPPGLRATL